MANEENLETNSTNGVTTSFRVPKRNLNINGIDKKNRPFNARFTRPIKKSEEISKLIESGLIKSVSFGSKNCFFVKELNEANKSDLLSKLNVEEKLSQLRYSEADIADNGWWTIETIVKDGLKPCKELTEAIDAYHSYDDPENKNCLTMYGEISLNVDFSKLNMISDESGISYPYGILFFSDSKSFVNQFSASCAVLPYRLEKARNNPYIKQIDNWENVSIKGSFRSTGHFVIFYVSSEEDVVVENGHAVAFPKVHMITIETILNREREGSISGVGIGKVEESEILAKHYVNENGDPFGSEIVYLIENAFSKYSTQSIAASHFASDYIYLVGDDPRYYDLSCLNSESAERKNPDDKFAGGDNKKKFQKSNKSNKNKNNKQNKAKQQNAVEESIVEKEPEATKTDVNQTEEADAKPECKEETPSTEEPQQNNDKETVKVEDSLITEVAAESKTDDVVQ